MSIFIIVSYIVLTVSGVLLMRCGATYDKVASLMILGYKINVITILGILCYGFSFMLWIYLLQKYEISKILPFTVGISNVITILGACFLLGESISILKGIGVAVIIAGLIIINL